MMTWVETKLVRRIEWAPQLETFCFDATLPSFVPGQWVNIAVHIDGQRVKRAYSLASAPGAAPEIFVTEVAGGALTPRLFAMQPGDVLEMETTTRGFFTLDYVPPAEDLWLVSTGTGLGPFISMLRNQALLHRFANLVVVHGVRHHEHLAYAEEIRASGSAQCPVHYVPVVSRDAKQIGVVPGRVTTALQSGQLEAAAGLALDPAKSHLMLCGNPDMIRELMTLLQARGLERHRVRKPGHITVEKYW